MNIAIAYGLGRQAAARGDKIKVPHFEPLVCTSVLALEVAFWQGVRDLYAEDRINQLD